MRFFFVALFAMACADPSLQGAAFQPGGAVTASMVDTTARAALALTAGETATYSIEVPADMGMLDVVLLGDPGASITLYAGGTPVCISGDEPRCTVSWPAPGTWSVEILADDPDAEPELQWRFGTEPPEEPTPSTPNGGEGASTPESGPDAESDLFCDVDPADMPADDGCVTEYVACGDVIEGTLEGGSNFYDVSTWSSRNELGGLLGNGHRVAGADRVYVVEGVQPGQSVYARVESCDDVWASYIVSGDLTDVCEPGWGPSGHFQSNVGRLDQEAFVRNAASGVWDVELVIDGEVGANASYRLTIECGD